MVMSKMEMNKSVNFFIGQDLNAGMAPEAFNYRYVAVNLYNFP
jgi:hypothetical protein